LIRPQQADGLLLLKAENMKAHGNFLKAGGWVVSNAGAAGSRKSETSVQDIDADALAQAIGNTKAVNLIVLGFALAQADKFEAKEGKLFCSLRDIESVLKNRFGKNKKMMAPSLKALEAGYNG